MSKFLFGLKVFLVAAAGYAAFFESGLLPSVPDWLAVILPLAASFVAGWFQKNADYTQLTRDIFDLLDMLDNGEIDLNEFRAKLEEIFEDVRLILA